MVLSPTSPTFLRSPPASPNPSKSLSTYLSPPPERLEFRRPALHFAAAASTCTTQPPAPLASTSLYEVLRIPIGASADDIKAAYRRLVRICHPDAVASSERRGFPNPAAVGDDEFMKIHSAYSTLSDPEKRADYDRKLFRRRIQPLGSSSQISSFGKHPRRNWETDQCW